MNPQQLQAALTSHTPRKTATTISKYIASAAAGGVVLGNFFIFRGAPKTKDGTTNDSAICAIAAGGGLIFHILLPREAPRNDDGQAQGYCAVVRGVLQDWVLPAAVTALFAAFAGLGDNEWVRAAVSCFAPPIIFIPVLLKCLFNSPNGSPHTVNFLRFLFQDGANAAGAGIFMKASLDATKDPKHMLHDGGITLAITSGLFLAASAVSMGVTVTNAKHKIIDNFVYAYDEHSEKWVQTHKIIGDDFFEYNPNTKQIGDRVAYAEDNLYTVIDS